MTYSGAYKAFKRKEEQHLEEMSRQRASALGGAFANQIREALKDAPVSIYRVSLDAKIPQGTLSRFVNGKAWLRENTMNRLAEYLGLSVNNPLPRPTAAPDD